MSDVNANINIDINSSTAIANLRKLEIQIDKFQRSIIGANSGLAAQQAAWNASLLSGINNTGMFNSRIVNVTDSVTRFSNAIEKGKLSLGDYARYSSAGLPGMSKVFRREFDTITQVAESRVKKIQTQYLALGRTVDGVTRAIASTPTALAPGYMTQMAVSTQRQQLFNKLIDDGSTKLLNWGKNTQWAGRQLMVGFSIPLAALGAVAAKTFSEIDKATLSLRRVYGDLSTSTEEIEANIDAIQKLGAEYTKYGISVAQSTEIAARAAATGAQNETLLAATEETLRFATLGQIDYQQALDATISLQTAFAISNDELASKIDFLNAVENQTILTIDDMSVAIPRVATVIKGLGGSVEDLTVMMTAMREGGVSAENAANALKSGLASLINPTKRATESMAQMGININEIVNKNRGDLMGLITDFANATNALDDFSRQQVFEQVFGKYQYARMSALFTNITDGAGQASRAMELAGKSAQELAAISQKELSAISETTTIKFQAAIENLKTSIAPLGEAFLKVLTPIANAASSIAQAFNNLPDSVKNVTAIIVGLVAGIGPILIMTLGLFANAIANIAKIVQFFRKKIAGIRGDASAFEYLTNAELESVTATKALETSAQNLTNKLLVQRTALQALTLEYERFAAVAGIAGGAMRPMGMGRGRSANAPAAGRGFRFSDGGTVPGTGNRDTIPALLTPGETVVTKEASEKYGSIINAMNNGTLPGFNDGLNAEGTEEQKYSSLYKDRKKLKEELSLRNISVVEKETVEYHLKTEEGRKKLVSALIKDDSYGGLAPRRGHAVARKALTPQQVQLYVQSDYSRNFDKNATNKRGYGYTNWVHFVPSIANQDYLTGEDFAKLFSDKKTSGLMMSIIDKDVIRKKTGLTRDKITKEVIDSFMNDNPSYKDFRQQYIEKMIELLRSDEYKDQLITSSGRNLSEFPQIEKDLLFKIDEEAYKESLKSTGGKGSKTIKRILNEVRNEITTIVPAWDEVHNGKIVERTGSRHAVSRQFQKESFGYQNPVPSYGYHEFPEGDSAYPLPTPENFKDPKKFVSSVKQSRSLNAIKKMAESKIPRFVFRNTGGPIFASNGTTVPGVGNTDTVPAMLTPGEFVINKQATAENLPLLRAINDGEIKQSVPGFNKGGKIHGIKYAPPGGQVSSDRLGYGIPSEFLASILKRGVFHQGNLENTSGLLRATPISQRIEKINSYPKKLAWGPAMYTSPSAEESGIYRFIYNRIMGVDPKNLNMYKLNWNPKLVEMAKEGKLKFYDHSNPAHRRKLAQQLGFSVSDKPQKGVPYFTKTTAPDPADTALHAAIQNGALIDLGYDAAYFPMANKSQVYRRHVSEGSHAIGSWKGAAQSAYTDLFGRRSDLGEFTILSDRLTPNVSRGGGDQAQSVYRRIGQSLSESFFNMSRKDQMQLIKERFKGRLSTKFNFTETDLENPASQSSLESLYRDYRLRKKKKMNQGGKVPLRFSNGNIVPGTGNTDTVPATLTPGEFVVNKQSTAENLSLLHAINNGEVSRFNGGGQSGQEPTQSHKSHVTASREYFGESALELARRVGTGQTKIQETIADMERLSAAGEDISKRFKVQTFTNAVLNEPELANTGKMLGKELSNLVSQNLEKVSAPFQEALSRASISEGLAVDPSRTKAMAEMFATEMAREYEKIGLQPVDDPLRVAAGERAYQSVMSSSEFDDNLKKALARTFTEETMLKVSTSSETSKSGKPIFRSLMGKDGTSTVGRVNIADATRGYKHGPGMEGLSPWTEEQLRAAMIPEGDAERYRIAAAERSGGRFREAYGHRGFGNQPGGYSQSVEEQARITAEIEKQRIEREKLSKVLTRIDKETMKTMKNRSVIDANEMRLARQRAEIEVRRQMIEEKTAEIRKTLPARTLLERISNMQQSSAEATRLVDDELSRAKQYATESETPKERTLRYRKAGMSAKTASQLARNEISSEDIKARQLEIRSKSGGKISLAEAEKIARQERRAQLEERYGPLKIKETPTQPGRAPKPPTFKERMMAKGKAMAPHMSGVGMAMSMASMAPAMMADEQGKFMGIDANAAMMAMMGGGTLLSLLPMLSGAALPVAAVGAAAAAVGVGLYAWRKNVDESAKKTAELGANMGGTANALNTMAKVLNMQTPAQTQKQLQLAFSKKEINSEQFGQFQQQLGSESGQAMLKDLSSRTTDQRIKMLTDYIVNAIAAGIMDQSTGQLFAKTVGLALNDAITGTAVSSAIRGQKTGSSALIELANKRVQAVGKTNAIEQIQSANMQRDIALIGGNKVSSDVASYAIGGSIQIIQDYSNVLAKAKQEYMDGTLAYEDYINVVREGTKVQEEYATVVRNAIAHTTDPGAARQALDTQLIASGMSQEQVDAITNSTNIGITSGTLGIIGNFAGQGIGQGGLSAYESDYVARQAQIQYKKSDSQLTQNEEDKLKNEAENAKHAAATMYASGLNEDLKMLAYSNKISPEGAAALGQQLMNDSLSAAAKQYQKQQRRGKGLLGLEQAGFMATAESGNISGLEKGGIQKYINVGIKFSEQGGSLEEYQSLINNLPEQKRVEIITTLGGLSGEDLQQAISGSSNILGIYGQELGARVLGSKVRTAAVERRTGNDIQYRTKRGRTGDAATPTSVEGFSVKRKYIATQTNLRAAERGDISQSDFGATRSKEDIENLKKIDDQLANMGKKLGAEKSMLVQVAVDSFQNGKEVDLDKWIKDSNRLTSKAGNIQDKLPKDWQSKINIDFTDPKEIETWSNVSDQFAENWNILSTLNPKIDMSTNIRFLTVDGEGNNLSPEQIAANVNKLNQAYKILSTTKNLKLKKEAMLTIITSMQDQNGKLLDPEQAQSIITDLADKFGGKVYNIDPALLYFQVDAIVDYTEMKKRGKELVEAGERLNKVTPNSGNGLIMQGTALMLEAKKGIAGAELAVKNLAKENASSGGGGGQENWLQILKRQAQEALKIFKMFNNIVAGNAPGFKKFISGPFAPEFIQFLQEQGIEAVNVLKGSTAKFREAYDAFVKKQQREAMTGAVLFPIEIMQQRKQQFATNALKGRMSSKGINAGMQEQIMSKLGTSAPLAASGLNKNKKGLSDAEKEAVKLFNTLTNKKALKEMQLLNDSIMTMQKTAAKTTLLFAQMGVPEDVTNAWIEQGYNVEDFKNAINGTDLALKKTLESLMLIQKINAFTKLTNELQSTAKQAANAANVMKLLPNASQELVDNLSQLDPNLFSDQDIIKYAGALDYLKNQQEKAKTSSTQLSEQLSAQAEAWQQSIEKINRLEIRPFENAIKSIQDYVEGLSDQIENIQRNLIRPLEDQINELQDKVGVIQDQIDELQKVEDETNKVYDKRIAALNKVFSINERIASQQKSQLSLAEALSSGDIYAAAQAMQEINDQDAAYAREDLMAGLETEKENAILAIQDEIATKQKEIEAINGQIEERQKSIETYNRNIRDIQDQIFIKQKEIAAIQKQIEEAKRRQLELEEKIYAVQLAQSAIEQKKKYEDALARGDVGEATAYASTFNASLEILKTMVGILPQELQNWVNQSLGTPLDLTSIQANVDRITAESAAKYSEFIATTITQYKLTGDQLTTAFQNAGLAYRQALSSSLENVPAGLNEAINSLIEKAKTKELTPEKITETLSTAGFSKDQINQFLPIISAAVTTVATETTKVGTETGKVGTEANKLAAAITKISTIISGLDVPLGGLSEKIKAFASGISSMFATDSATGKDGKPAPSAMGAGMLQKISESLSGLFATADPNLIISQIFQPLASLFNADTLDITPISLIVNQIGEAMNSLIEPLQIAFSSFVEQLSVVLKGSLENIANSITAVAVSFLELIRQKLNGIVVSFNPNSLKVVFPPVTYTLKNGSTGTFEGAVVSGNVPSVKSSAAVPALFAGGPIIGSGSRDSIPLMAAPGEFIMRRAAVDKYGSTMLSSMNTGSYSIPKYDIPEVSTPSITTLDNRTNIMAPVYNTYSVNVPVTNPGASADEIANKVMVRMQRLDSSNIRSIRGNK